ncbi:MAG: LarC family nickel insertion protein [Phycisphaeraceae bacterium]
MFICGWCASGGLAMGLASSVIITAMTRHLHLDPFSGIAGDMFLGAMIDLSVPLAKLEAVLAPLPVERPYRLTAERAFRCGVGGVDFKVHLEPATHASPAAHAHAQPTAASEAGTHHDHHHHGHHHGDDHGHSQRAGHGDHHHDAPAHDRHQHHHHTGYREIMAMIDQLDIAERGRDRARRIVTALGEAEARVHGKPIEQVHFHEVGAVDSIVDMLGAAVALEMLDVDTLSCGPLPISRGYVRCDHGLMPVPAPATAYLLETLPTIGVDRTGELITPTGAAIVRALCDSLGPPPAMTFAKVGYGAGDRDDPAVPNLLRAVLGERR